MANTQTQFHPDQSSLITYLQHPQPNNNFVPQPSFNANYMQQPMQNPEDILDPTTVIDMTLVLMAKAFTLNDTTPINNNQKSSSNPSNMQIAQPDMNIDQDRQMLMVENNVGNQFRSNAVQNVRNQVFQNAVQNPGVQNVGNHNGLSVDPGIANQYGIGNFVTARAEANGNGINGNQIRCYNCQGVDHYASNYTVKPRKRDVAYLQKQMQIAQKEEAGIQLTSEEFDFMAVAGACEETERANTNCSLENNLQQASTSNTQSDKALVYDSDGSAEVHLSENCYDNDIFNMFTQEKYIEQGGGIVEQHSATVKETRAYHESLFHNLATEVEKVNSVNRKMKETNAELTTELARYKNQEKCFEISQEKYDKLERCYQKSVYQEQFQIAKEADESLAKHKALELEIERLLRAIVSQDIMSIVQCNSVVDTSNLQTELECTKERFENCIIKKENEYAKLWNNWYKKCEECKYDKISYDKAYHDMQQKIKRLQAQLGDLKGKSKDTLCVSDTLDPLSHKLENENVELEFQVSERKDTTKGSSVNTQFCKQSILGKPPSSFGLKLYSVIPFPKSKGLPKIDESHALSKPVTSNSVPTPTESKVVKNDNVISLGIFWINPLKASRVDNFVPNKHVKASVRTKPITVSQPYVITKNDVNSNTNGFSPKDVKSTTRTRRPQPRNNPKNDKVPSKSKSSWLSNNLEKIEENHRNLQSSSNQKHMSSECNNIKLAIRNAKSEVVYAMCKQCLITVNHDVCMLNYVNDMNSRDLNKNENVSNVENQKKHKPKVRKPKKVGSKEKLASPKPSTPRSCLRWSPTGRIFDLKGKIIATSESVCQSDCSKGDNACTSKPQEPISKRFPNSTFSMTGCQNWLDTLLIPLLSEYKPKDKENHEDNECDI
ncbi:hypothetical protein Tco_0820028 [Tanacetum coccineum]|uniref:Uncharacterized protein n=1 Tax=Tanacetum coccineum TaxID=301880 RepID=A0ABQ5ACJ3_9ASTR